MRLINMTCPNCGAQLQVDADKKQVFCEHCGTKLLIDDNVYHIQYDNAEDAGFRHMSGFSRPDIQSKNHLRRERRGFGYSGGFSYFLYL